MCQGFNASRTNLAHRAMGDNFKYFDPALAASEDWLTKKLAHPEYKAPTALQETKTPDANEYRTPQRKSSQRTILTGTSGVVPSSMSLGSTYLGGQ